MVEVLVGFALIMIIMSMSALAITQALGVQQNTERNARGVQLARDYVEKIQGSKWAYQGFHVDNWDQGDASLNRTLVVVTPPSPSNPKGVYKTREAYDGNISEFVSITSDDLRTTGIFPKEKRAIGGVEYTITTDILVKDPNNEYSTHIIRVKVEYVDDKNKNKVISVEALRAPNPSERIPSSADESLFPGANGRPGSPQMSDHAGQKTGFIYNPGGRVDIKVRTPVHGDYPVTNIAYVVTCGNKETFRFTQKPATAGIIASNSSNLWSISVNPNLPSFKCPLSSVGTEIDITAVNQAGESAPLRVSAPDNFDKIGG